MKILYTNTNCSWNKGSSSQVISSTKIIRQFIPNTEFTLMSHDYGLDLKGCSPHDIRVVSFNPRRSSKGFLRYYFFWYIFSLIRCFLFVFLKKIGISATSLINREVLRDYFNVDVIIDLSGDSFSDSEGGDSIINCLNLLFGILFKKPIILYSQSIGPFKPITLAFAKFCLSRTKMIILRENVSKNYLDTIGVKKPKIYVTADAAFMLEAASENSVQKILKTESIPQNNQALIGLSISELVYRSVELKKFPSANRYISMMAQAVDYLIEKLDAIVVFVPHVFLKNGFDDRIVAEKIISHVKNKKMTRIILNEYTPEELRGVISQFDLFIGARMHANISALSMHVPTIAIAWHHKYYGIMKNLGQENYVFNVKTMNFNDLLIKVNKAWYNREKIRRTLKNRIETQRNLAAYNGKLVKDLLNK